MQHRTLFGDELLNERRERWDNESGRMTLDVTRLVDPKVGRRREWPKASADSLLSFAAAPTFAGMALLTATGGEPQLLCSAAHLASPLSGMVAMYLLMSAFHSAPWLKLVSGRRSGASRS
jgi:hypothetical protein